MDMDGIREISLVNASVDAAATFEEAARILSDNRCASIAVVEQGRVIGLFTDEELLLGISPRYLDELKHTAFLEPDLSSLRDSAAEVRREPVRKHMRKPVTVQQDGSVFHAAERFVHTDETAIAVVDRTEQFVGMLSRTELAHALLRRLLADRTT
jgi:CBS domain-containing protein